MGLVTDRHECEEVVVDVRVPQGSPVSPIRFAIYLSGVFKKVEKEVEGCVATLFADDCGWLVVTNSVEKLYERLERAEIKAVEW